MRELPFKLKPKSKAQKTSTETQICKKKKHITQSKTLEYQKTLEAHVKLNVNSSLEDMELSMSFHRKLEIIQTAAKKGWFAVKTKIRKKYFQIG